MTATEKPASAPKQVPAVPTKQSTPVPDQTPAEAQSAGKELDAARAELSAIQSQRQPGLTQGRAAMDAYQQKLTMAQQRVKGLQAQYESLVGNTSAPAGRAYPNP